MDKDFNKMDERFKNIENEMNFQYQKSMFDDVENLLNNQAMDEAFIEASKNTNSFFIPPINHIDDLFIDEAFKSAAENVETQYSQSYFQDYLNNEADLVMDESFHQAAKSISTPYQSSFWKDADLALQNEGLHYEYKKEYWNEVEKLLHQNDRKLFFIRWSIAATLLLLFSLTGIQFLNQSETNHLALTSHKHSYNHNLTIKQKANHNKFNTDNLTASTHLSDEQLINNGNNNQHSFQNNNQIDVSIQNTLNRNQTESSNPTNSDETSDFNNLTNNNSDYIENISLVDHSKTIFEQKKDAELKNEIINIQKINVNHSALIPVKKLIPTIEIEDFSQKIKGTHTISIKANKGIGNNYAANSYTNLTPRNSIAVDYRFQPFQKLKRFEFGGDLGFYHISLADYSMERTYSVYNKEGSVTHYWYKMQYHDLIFMSGNFNTYVHFNKKSKFKFGIGLDKYLTSRIDLEYTESNTGDMNLKKNNWGVNEGIENFDFNLLLGYEHQLNQKFSFLIDTRLGLFDKTKKSYFNHNESIREISFQIGFRYQIFNKI